jgi:hypothetical protein
MKKIVLFAFCSLLITSVFAQDSLSTRTGYSSAKPKVNLVGRSNDHFLLQLGYTGWAGIPDSINTGGFSKSLNFYLMFDFPFKTNPKLSMAFGPGISSDQIQFKKTYVGIKDQTTLLQFRDQSDTNHFKRTKLATVYLEAPIEFRYTHNPANPNKSLKFALGVKVGTMINAHTRNKTLQTSSGATLNDYLMKESSKKYFNTTRLSGQARIGLGHFSLYGTYQFTNLFKEGVAAEIRPYSIGITLSGL